MKLFENAIIKRTNHLQHPIFICLSSGYDSGAIACSLQKLNVPFDSYTIKAAENLKILRERMQYHTDNRNNVIQINLALNYGSKNEIITTIKKLKKKGEIINEENFEKNLFTKNIPNPEILIRTGNTKRLSNFLLWQLAYSEIFFEKKLWPDFNEFDFEKIIKKYKKIKRNFGKI